MIITLLALAMLACVYFGLIRNHQVYDFRMDMIDTIHENNKRTINALPDTPGMTVERVEAEGRLLNAKWDTYASVGYASMVLKFWKPLKPEAWYADTSFLK